MSKHENDIRLTSCDKGKRQMAVRQLLLRQCSSLLLLFHLSLL